MIPFSVQYGERIMRGLMPEDPPPTHDKIVKAIHLLAETVAWPEEVQELIGRLEGRELPAEMEAWRQETLARRRAEYTDLLARFARSYEAQSQEVPGV